MISQTTEYALRAIIYLASRQEQLQTTQQIADATQVPVDYLAKVLQNLRKAGLVHSQRGLHGGCSLVVSANRLTVYDIVQAVDPIHRIRHCPLGIKGHINLCPLHRRLDDAISLVENALKASTIAELLAEPDRRRGIPMPLCSWPEETTESPANPR